MLKKLLSWLAVIALLTTTVSAYTKESSIDKYNREVKVYSYATEDQDFDDHTILVVIDKNVGAVNKKFDVSFFGSEEEIESIKDLTEMPEETEDLYLNEESFRQILLITLKKHDKKNVLKIINRFEKVDGIKYVGPNYIGVKTEVSLTTKDNLKIDDQVSDEIQGKVLIDSNHELIDNQEDNERFFEVDKSDDVSSYTISANDTYYGSQWGLGAINASNAWNITTGSKNVKVGVIDTGIARHPDLNDNLVAGYDFVNDVAIDPNNSAYPGDTDGHGTHVAGIIGAKGNNGTGVTGVCWNVSLVPLRISGGTDQVISAIKYAKINKIPILNHSWWNYSNDEALKTAIESYSGLYVCIAGNAGQNIDIIPNYPASFNCDNMISVANATSLYTLNSNSNFGVSTVDIAAPGTNILSTVPTSIDSSGYQYWDGTSMAAPFVSGVAALILSVCPNLPGTYLKYLLTNYADGRSELNGKVANSAFLNAEAAVNAAKNKIVNVTFNANGGSCAVSSRYYIKGQVYSDLPTPTPPAGHRFDGWYNSAAGGSKYSGNTTVDGTQTLYAHWVPIRYTVTYDSDGGSVVSSVTVEAGKSHTVKGAPVKEGYGFAGWVRVSDGQIFQPNDVIKNIQGNVTLKAKWVRCMISYELNGGTDGPSKTNFVIPGGSSIVVGPSPVRNGYKFIGWKRNKVNNIYMPGDSIENIWSNIVLEAQWEELYCFIKYEPQYFSSFPIRTVFFSETINGKIPCSLLPFPGVGSYIFQGWTIKGGDGTVYTPGDTGTLPGFKNYTLEDVAGKRIKGNLYFDANGGQNAPDPQFVFYSEKVTIPKEEPTREGYTFLGWSQEPDGQVEYVPGMRTLTGADKTVYAQWVSDDFVIRFDTGTNQNDEVQAYDPPLSVTYSVSNSAGITLPDQTMERPGYTFKGWSYTYNGNTTIYGSGQNFVIPASVLAGFDADGGNIVKLTAVWEQYSEEQLIAFVDVPKYGGKTNTVYLRNATRGMTYGEVRDIENGTVVGLPAVADTDEAYFDGWADAQGNRVMAQTKVKKNGFHMLYARMIPKTSYTDVSATQYEYALKSVAVCKAYNYMVGTETDTFSPALPVTRGIAAIVLYRLAGGSPYYGGNQYYDVATNSGELSRAVTWISENDIATGRNTKNFYFGQADVLTREELSIMLYRYAKLMKVDECTMKNNEFDEKFSDKGDFEYGGYTSMVWAYSCGIISGVDGTHVDPRGTVTRAQLAVFIARMQALLIERGVFDTILDGYVNTVAEELGQVSATLSDNSWETISAVSHAGVADLIWHIGDEISMTLSTGEVVDLQIYGFNHDKVSENNYAGITFGMQSVMKTPRYVHGFDTNRCPYPTTILGIWLDDTLSAQLPSDVSDVIQPVKKVCTEIDDDGNPFMTEVTLPIFLFSEEECFGRTNHSFGGEGTQYEIFKINANNRIKTREPQHIIEWWLRSPCRTNDKSYCIVHSTGQAGYAPTSRDYIGVSFGFCV